MNKSYACSCFEKYLNLFYNRLNLIKRVVAIHNITIKQLKVFACVCKYGSLTAAAEQLFVTKAAVSIALQQLEEQLGRPLFDRVKNRLQLNDEGRKLVPRADEILQRMAEIENLYAGDSLSGQLRIGASITVGNHLLPHLLADFMRETPSQRPQIEVANSGQLCAKLAAFELDIALLEGQVVDHSLHVLPWRQDEMLVVASPQHPLAQQGPLTLEDLADLPWLLREPRSGTREQFNRRLLPQLPSWHIGLELNSNEAVINAVAAGLGLGFISNLAAAAAIADRRLAVLPLAQRWPRQLSIVTPKEKYVSELLARFIEFSKH
ncbi:MAG: LysR substrate-binding domain-containing protein, partial [Pseudomonadales bacterium]